MDWRRLGGIAALFEAGTFVFGFLLFVTVLSDYSTGDPTPSESVAFLVDHQAALFAWHLVILVLFGVALVPLVLAMRAREPDPATPMSHVAAVFGMIWAGLVIASGMIANLGLGTVADLQDTDPAQADAVWSAIDSVQNALGGGNELVGGLWVLLVSVAALQTGTLPRRLCHLGVASGAAGIVTIVPALEAVGGLFGLGLIAWFTWTGLVLLREPAAVRPPPVRA